MSKMLDCIRKELAVRDRLSLDLMIIIYNKVEISNKFGAKIQRSVIQNYVFQELGFHGRCGNDFARFINKIMQENGFRAGWSGGKRVFFGLKIKN